MPLNTYSSSSHLRVGVLLAPPPVQLLDIAPVDLFHMLSKDYLKLMPMLPQSVKDLALDKIEICYLADKEDTSITTRNTLASTDALQSPPEPIIDTSLSPLAPLTADMHIRLDCPLSDPSVQPGHLSILLIPGPDPSATASSASAAFMQRHASSGKTDIITICTGIYPACQAGICDGLVVTAPRGLLSDLRGKFPNVQRFEDKRWSRCELDSSLSTSKGTEDASNCVVIGESRPEPGHERKAELWTAAGITNGLDCVAAYIKAHFDRDLAEIVCRIADVGGRSRDYDNGRIVENMWWISRILNTVIKGLWSKG